MKRDAGLAHFTLTPWDKLKGVLAKLTPAERKEILNEL